MGLNGFRLGLVLVLSVCARVCVCSQVLNKLDEFEEGVRKTLKDVRLDNDVVVSVFETNIRVLGYAIIKQYFIFFIFHPILEVPKL